MEKYEVENGLLGVKRDIFLKLTNLCGGKLQKIRSMIGMCSQCYSWKLHSHFKLFRFRNTHFPFSLRPSSRGKYDIIVIPTSDGTKLSFYSSCVACMDPVMTEGIFRWTVRLSFDDRTSSHFQIGVTHSDNSLKHSILTVNDAAPYGEIFHLDRFVRRVGVFDDLCSVDMLWIKPSEKKCLIPYGALMTLEVDLNAHTLSLFADHEKIPKVFTRVPEPSIFCVSGSEQTSLTHISLLRVRAATVSKSVPAVACIFMESPSVRVPKRI